MPYIKQDLVDASGLPGRTIRNYIARGLIPAAEGHGLAAVYTEEAMLRAVTIGRMRAEGHHIDAITDAIARWTLGKFKRFVADTDPEPEPEPEEAPAPETSLAGGAPRNEDAIHHREPILDLALPAGPSFRMVPLLPGLGLLLDTSASPIVQRIAAEICDRYGQR